MGSIIVIGGGPAGMMAAIAAADAGHAVRLIEQNEKLGKKLYITGKGRGNFTNAADIGDFFDKIVRNPKFLYSALYGFSNLSLLAFLEEQGLRWKEERGGRIFPASDHASDVTKVLTHALEARRVTVQLGTQVKGLLTKEADSRAAGSLDTLVRGVRLLNGQTLTADHVIVATGGLSYPSTGAGGDGIRFAGQLGLATEETHPALVPLVVQEADIPAMQGLSLKNVTLWIDGKKRSLFEGFGELLFTHFGISGPLALSASSHVTALAASGEPLAAHIDLKPARSAEQLDRRLLEQTDTCRKRVFSHFFEGLLPRKMQGVCVKRSGIAPDRMIGSLTAEERHRIGALLKAFPLTIIGTRGFNEAVITRGGVAVSELDPATMKAKRIDGLSFAGEVIDVDALTGGYNLQIAFSTGYLAGSSV